MWKRHYQIKPSGLWHRVKINSYGNYLPSDAASYPKRPESALTLLRQQRTYLANQ